MQKENTVAQAEPALSSGPLAGVRVLDLTSVVLGPLATQILGDYGADIIKVEGPEGDVSRARGVTLTPGMASIFMSINRNKRSVSLDLKSPQGCDVLRRLITNCDVLVHNMRVQAIERLGFGYEAVKAIKPDIVYCVATGFDQDGPDKNKPAFDDIIQAACGLVSLSSRDRDYPDYSPTLVADKTAGMAVVNAVLAALFHRERTGHGQYVEVPMFETLVSFMLIEHLAGLTFATSGLKGGYNRLLSEGRKPSRTKDGYVAILPYTAEHWTKFFTWAGRAELVEKYHVNDRQSRSDNIPAMYRSMAEITAERTTSEWLQICSELDIPSSLIYSIDELLEHPQLQAIGLFDMADHPLVGSIRYLNPPTKFYSTPASVRTMAPSLGEHSREVLLEHGYSDAELQELTQSGAVRLSQPVPSPSSWPSKGEEHV